MTVPQSLLVAALALAWLIVLVPMVSRKGRTVEESVEGRGFRVLPRGDSVSKASRFRRRSSMVTAGESRIDADGTDEETDNTEAQNSVLAEYPQTEAAKKWLAAQQIAKSRTAGNEDDMSVEYPDNEATTEIAVTRPGNEAEPAEYADTDDSGDDHREAGYAEVDAEYGDAEYSADEVSGAEYPATEYPRAHDNEAEHTEAGFESQYEPAPVSHENHRRQGRGGFDPEAAETARRFRYAKRQRVALILVVLTVIFTAAAVTLVPTLWIGAGITGVLLVAYLTYLRRQVRIEEEVRQRRSARLQRARQIRPERFNDAGIEYSHAPEYAAEAYPVSQIPGPAYDRRGRVVVDLEDDDPGFDDLDQYEPIVYQRASGQ